MMNSRLALIFTALILACGLANAQAPNFFSAIDDPSGVAASRQKLLLTEYCGDHRHILSVSPAGKWSIFSTLPSTGGGCGESYLAIAPGFGGFPANYIYVTYGNQVLQVTPDGKTVTVFADLPSTASTHGISFDHVGSFSNMMIVDGSDGQVFTIMPNGQVNLLVNVGTWTEGSSVAPMWFGPYGGQILVAAENANAVMAIDQSGRVSSVAGWKEAESVRTIPTRQCTYQNTGMTFFQVAYPTVDGRTGLLSFSSSVFAPERGKVMVVGEQGSGIGLLLSQHGSIQTQNWLDNIGDLEGGAFVDCMIPEEVPILARPEPTVMDNDDHGVKEAEVVVLSTASFNATQLMTRSIRFGKIGSENSVRRCSVKDVNHDGRLDLVCDIDVSKTNISATDTAVNLTAQSLSGNHVSGYTPVPLNLF